MSHHMVARSATTTAFWRGFHTFFRVPVRLDKIVEFNQTFTAYGHIWANLPSIPF